MAQNIYANYDPISANGILHAPIKDLTFSDLPVSLPHPGYGQIPMSTSQQVDKFVSLAKNPNPTPTWKKVLFYGLLAGLTVAGCRKFKINPFKKLMSALNPKSWGTKISNGYKATKDFIINKYGAIKNYITSKFHKP